MHQLCHRTSIVLLILLFDTGSVDLSGAAQGRFLRTGNLRN